MRPGRDKRLTSLIKRLAAEFLERELVQKFILTVNRVELLANGRRAKIYVTIFPDAAELTGLNAARQLVRPLAEWLKNRLPLKHIPRPEIIIDEEEKLKRNNPDGAVAKW